jgi:hypothetical protein
LWFAELQSGAGDILQYLEVCPQGMSLAGDLATRVAKEGGAALVIDYGRERPYPASLVGIRGHSFVNMLSQPGLADLSVHVDFGALRSACTLSWHCTQPVELSCSPIRRMEMHPMGYQSANRATHGVYAGKHLFVPLQKGCLML